MAKLNIDIGVNLGNAIKNLDALQSAFDGVSASLEKFTNNVNTLKTSLGQLKSTSVNVNVKQSTIQSGGLTQPKMSPVPDIFASYRSGASGATTVTEFLKQKQSELENQIRKLQSIASNTTSLKIYEEAQRRIGVASKQLSQINISSSITNTGKSATYANMALTDMGRVVQDLPYGFLGISNNLNPLVESFRALSVQAKASGTSVGKELLNSLKGFGGVGIAISAVSAALSFASIGLSYWTRRSQKAKDDNDKLTESLNKSRDAALSQGFNLNNLLAVAENSAKGSRQQKLAIDKLNEGLKQYGISLDEAAIKNGTAKEKVDALTQSLVQQAIANTYVEEAAKKQRELNDALDSQKELQDKFLGKNKNNKEAISALNRLIVDYTTSLNGLGIDLNDVSNKYLYGSKLTDRQIDTYTKLVAKVKEVTGVTERGIFNVMISQLSGVQLQANDAKDGLDKFTQKAKSAQSLSFDFGAKAGVQTQTELDKSNKKAQTLAQYFAEVKRDVNNINNNPLTPFDTKQQQIAARLEEAIKYIVDKEEFKVALEADLKLPESQFKQFQSQLSGARIKLFGTQQQDEFNQFIQKLKTNADTADILGTDRIDASINDTTGYIARLIEARRKFSEEPIDATQILAFADVLLDIDDLLEKATIKLKQLGEQKAFEERVKSLREFGISMDLLSKKMSDLDKNPFLSEGSTDKLKKQAQTQREIVSTLRKQLGEEFDKSKGAITPFIKQLQKDLEKGEITLAQFEQKLRAAKLAEEINAAFEDALMGIAEGIASIMSGDNIGDVFGSIFSKLSESLGKALLSFAKDAAKAKGVVDTLKKVLFGEGPIGWAAIAATAALGIALIASGKLLGKKGFAKGGYVSGDGTGTSDSIPAKLSNGEYVIRANSVSRYGTGFLNAINNGTFKRFAAGGLVTNFGIPGMQSMSMNNLIAKPVTVPSGSGYIAETRISGQDLRLILSRSDSRFNSSTSNPATSKSFLV